MEALLCPVTPTRKLASRPLGLIGSFYSLKRFRLKKDKNTTGIIVPDKSVPISRPTALHCLRNPWLYSNYRIDRYLSQEI